MNSSFWSNVWANFLADVLAGVLVGGGLAWWIGGRLNELARTEERRREKRKELQKSIRYLGFLKEEIGHLLNELPGLTKKFEETGWGREIRIMTPYWDILQPSGELPKLINPDLLALLALFYDDLAYAKRGRDLTIDSWLVSQPHTVEAIEAKRQAFVNMTLVGLSRAQNSGRVLPDKLDSEIQVLKKQLDTL